MPHSITSVHVSALGATERIWQSSNPDLVPRASRIDWWADHGVMAERYEYKVLELREKMIGGKMSGDRLERVLNEHAAQGWRLKAITAWDPVASKGCW
jgi:hypothetical protein